MDMQIETGKMKAICEALDCDVDPDAAVRAALEAKRKLTLFEIYHRGIGWIEAQIFKVEEKEKSKVTK